MKATSATSIEGRFLHVVYSPRGEIEGMMLDVDAKPIQVVFDKHALETDAARFRRLQAGQSLKLKAMPAKPSPKGQGDHAVYDFQDLMAVDGHAPEAGAADEDERYRGTVERFNYARHGEINGVVLDTGDFLHLKPEGYARLGLKIGDVVEADGDAQQLADRRGWAVDASEVNGRQVIKR